MSLTRAKHVKMTQMDTNSLMARVLGLQCSENQLEDKFLDVVAMVISSWSHPLVHLQAF